MPMAERFAQWEHAAPSAEDAARESDHRIANNLQLLMAMVMAEQRDITDPGTRLVLDRITSRIGAIAGVHRHLTHRADNRTVEFGTYLRTLAQQIEAGCCDTVAGRRLIVTADTVIVPTRLAAAVGLIASEAVLNACKYAYPGEAGGEVRIDLRVAAAGALRLVIEDDGTGPAPDTAASGFGTRLTAMLASRIGAALLRENARPGTRIILAIPMA